MTVTESPNSHGDKLDADKEAAPAVGTQDGITASRGRNAHPPTSNTADSDSIDSILTFLLNLLRRLVHLLARVARYRPGRRRPHSDPTLHSTSREVNTLETHQHTEVEQEAPQNIQQEQQKDVMAFPRQSNGERTSQHQQQMLQQQAQQKKTMPQPINRGVLGSITNATPPISTPNSKQAFHLKPVLPPTPSQIPLPDTPAPQTNPARPLPPLKTDVPRPTLPTSLSTAELISQITDPVARLALHDTPDVLASARLSRLQQKLQENVLLKLGGTSDDAAKAAAAIIAAGEAGNYGILSPTTPLDEDEDPLRAAERKVHKAFMDEALKMARTALETNETPVGAVFVHQGRVIARGMNATNVTRNGTRHAELMALNALLSYKPMTEAEEAAARKSKKSKKAKKKDGGDYTEEEWAQVKPDEGHIFPYGQKLHPAPRVDRSILKDCTLYVTVEPCVMCASMLRQFGLKKCYFGAVNDKFGGTGGVFCIHMNSDKANGPAPKASHRPVGNQAPKPSTSPSKALTNGKADGNPDEEANGWSDSNDPAVKLAPPPVPQSNFSVGHGGNVEDGFEAEGGWGRDEAVHLLRLFYVQENERAPVPRKKEGRAARLAAMTGDTSIALNADSNTPEDGSTDTSPIDKGMASTDIPMVLGSPAAEKGNDELAMAKHELKAHVTA